VMRHSGLNSNCHIGQRQKTSVGFASAREQRDKSAGGWLVQDNKQADLWAKLEGCRC
jgi:hypothetical protein